jgi:DNA-binding response OmpR family regulator
MSLNILLIQDDAQGAQAVRDALINSSDRRFRVEWVRTCALGLERLSILDKQHRHGSGEISAVLVDLLLPDVAGMEIVD